MNEALPRNIAGLAFRLTGSGIESRASEGFWALWRHYADALRALGMRPSKRHEGSKLEHWIVTWSPGIGIDAARSLVGKYHRQLERGEIA